MQAFVEWSRGDLVKAVSRNSVIVKAPSLRLQNDLVKLVSGDVFIDKIHRAAFSSDASIYQIVPACVVAPRDTQDVAAVVKYARGEGLSVSARGAGSGVAGESLCEGILLDMTVYMRRILKISEDGGFVVCEPGAVLDDLNKRLSGYGRMIGPDPSTSNRATIGGCVANNATGSHSLAYGYMGEYVESVEAVTSEGEVVEFVNDFEPAGEGSASRLGKGCLEVLGGKEDIIDAALPKSQRNRSGYNVGGICYSGRVDMARLLAGSEGTLVIFTKVTLRTVSMPVYKGMLVLEFDELNSMAKSVPLIVESGAAACELMDRRLMSMAVEAMPKYADILPSERKAVLFVEQSGDTEDEVREKISRTYDVAGKLAVGRRFYFDSIEQGRVSKARKDAVPLLYRSKSRKRPVPFVEDASVNNCSLGEYIEGLEEIWENYGVETSYYGHAGDGELHIRPYLDLGDVGDVAKMLGIANDVFTLVWSLGGSISGEHADGLVRAAFIRRQYGDDFYGLLCGIKRLFDPENILNPGKIISGDTDVMTRNLRASNKVLKERLSTDLPVDVDELAIELEQCNGCGLCLSSEDDLRMCPVFRAMGDELGSSRAKANVLRLWASGELDDEDLESGDFRKFLDLCVNCKACSLQCPSGVDISKLMMAARAEYVRRKGLRRSEKALSGNRYFSVLGGIFAPLSNFVLRLRVFRWVLEKITGLDRRRAFPAFKRGSFLKAGRKYLEALGPVSNPTDKVAYFVDTYVNYNDHETGYCVIDVLRANDIEVILPKQLPAPLPAMIYGDVKRVRKDLSYSVRYLSEAVRAGYKVVCSEPSAALCLREEMRHFIKGEDVRAVSENIYELMSYLLANYKAGKLKRPIRRPTVNYAYHTPCHLFAMGVEGASVELLRELCGLDVNDLDAGCCGLAGTFGMQKKNYELSQEISRNLRESLGRSSTKDVLTECGACGMQIEHISDASVRHPVKVLADCYKV